jgi:TetR/AcrR family transcriptional regulator, fatty acid metabolism regulator protein
MAQAPREREARERRLREGRARTSDEEREARPKGMVMGRARTTGEVDKRRQILDAAVRVFARQGFHATRVSDIADEAGVAYGLVYHYFSSKEQVMNELFSERWSLLLKAIAEADSGPASPREKLAQVAAFIVDSYRHDPELMKVIIVEVTRAANSFGRTHLPEIRSAYEGIARIVADGQEQGAFRPDVDPDFASMSFYGAIEQLLSGWIFDLIPAGVEDYDRAKELVVETICGGLEPRA